MKNEMQERRLFIVATEDIYFEQGVRFLLLDANFIKTLSNINISACFNMEQIVLLIDNRLPFNKLCLQIDFIVFNFKCVSVVMFEVSSNVIYRKMTELFGRYVSVRSLCQTRTLICLIDENEVEFAPLLLSNFIFSEKERDVICLGLSSLDVSEQARRLGCPNKKLYARRRNLQIRLKLNNFTQVCIFTLRNKIFQP